MYHSASCYIAIYIAAPPGGLCQNGGVGWGVGGGVMNWTVYNVPIPMGDLKTFFVLTILSWKTSSMILVLM